MNWFLAQLYATFRCATWPIEFVFGYFITAAVLLSCDELVRSYVIARIEQHGGGMSPRLLFRFRREGIEALKDVRRR